MLEKKLLLFKKKHALWLFIGYHIQYHVKSRSASIHNKDIDYNTMIENKK